MENTKKKLLEIIENDARLTPDKIAVMLDKSTDEIKALIKSLEEDGTIRGYKALVDWDKTDKEWVTAFIELKVAPQEDKGFEKIAEKISSFPEVRDLHLMSGVFDFLVLVEGKSLKEVAWFVAEKLSTIDGVLSTSTHFILRKYKEIGVVFGHEPEKDEREGSL